MRKGLEMAQDPQLDRDRQETTSVGGKEYTIAELRAWVERYPEQDIPLDQLREAVGPGHVYWVDSEGNDLAPSQIIENWEAAQGIDAWADHVASIKRADLTKPIWVTSTGAVFDGVHRLTRAVIDNQSTVRARIVTELPK